MEVGRAVDRTAVVGWPLAADKAAVGAGATLAVGKLAWPVVGTVAVELTVQAFESG